MSILCHFRALWGPWPGLASLDLPLRSWLPAPVYTYMCVLIELKDDIGTEYFQKVYANSSLHRQIISRIQAKHSGVEVEAVWSNPTPTPGSLPRLRVTPTPTLTPHPCPILSKIRRKKAILTPNGLEWPEREVVGAKLHMFHREWHNLSKYWAKYHVSTLAFGIRGIWTFSYSRINAS